MLHVNSGKPKEKQSITNRKQDSAISTSPSYSAHITALTTLPFIIKTSLSRRQTHTGNASPVVFTAGTRAPQQRTSPRAIPFLGTYPKTFTEVCKTHTYGPTSHHLVTRNSNNANDHNGYGTSSEIVFSVLT